MNEWALEHPWMTFFIALAAIEGATNIVKYIVIFKKRNK